MHDNGVRNISAATKYANAPQSDAQPMVMHVVTGEFEGRRVWWQTMATDPMHAIDKARRISGHLWYDVQGVKL